MSEFPMKLSVANKGTSWRYLLRGELVGYSGCFRTLHKDGTVGVRFLRRCPWASR